MIPNDRTWRSGTRSLFLVLAAAWMLFCTTGCFIQSFHPFYTEKSKVKTPDKIQGEWILMREGGDRVKKEIRAWRFHKKHVITYDKKGVASKLDLTFFKVGPQLYCDFIAGEPKDDMVNQFWIMHVVPVHSVCKVDLQIDRLKLYPINPKWIDKQMKKENLELKHELRDGGLLFVASPEEWHEFLSVHGNNPETFSENQVWELVRQQSF